MGRSSKFKDKMFFRNRPAPVVQQPPSLRAEPLPEPQTSIDSEVVCHLPDALDHYGIPYKMNKRSIILENCPSCNKKWSVWLLKHLKTNHNLSGGMCWKCSKTYTSVSLLMDLQVDSYNAIIKALNIHGDKEIDTVNMTLPPLMDEETKKQIKYVEEIDIPDKIIPISAWPEHQASIYARKRGIVPPLTDTIFIDPMANAVMFPILYGDLLVGFQSRFVTPINDKFRMRTDPNVPKAYSFVDIGNEEDPICVVEGPFDAVAAAWFGFRGMATMGKDISRYQASQLCSLAVANGHDRVYIGFDSDPAGELGARTLARHIDSFGQKLTRILPKGAKDLNEYLSVRLLKGTEETITPFDFNEHLEVLHDWMWDIPLLDDEFAKEFKIEPAKYQNLRKYENRNIKFKRSLPYEQKLKLHK